MWNICMALEKRRKQLFFPLYRPQTNIFFVFVVVWEWIHKCKSVWVCIKIQVFVCLFVFTMTTHYCCTPLCNCRAGLAAWKALVFKFGQMLEEGTKHVLSSTALATEVLTAISLTFFFEAMLMMMLIFRFVSSSSSPGSVKERVLDNLWLCKYYRRIC